MHGHQHVVAAGYDRAIDGDRGGQEVTDDWNCSTWKTQLPANAEGEGATDEKKSECCPEVLEADHLVIVGPKIFFYKTHIMVLVVGMGFVNWCVRSDCCHLNNGI